MSIQTDPVQVVSFYRFGSIANPAAHEPAIVGLCREKQLNGTIIIAGEGINGSLSGRPDRIADVLAALERIMGGRPLQKRATMAVAPPFRRMKVRIKQEIVSIGDPSAAPAAGVGAYVEPENWNELITADDVVLIDTRNRYETAIGTFQGAVDPNTERFRDFPEWFRRMRPLLFSGGRTRAALFCTGGIRCEKATALLRAEGVSEVFHLKGGILSYLDRVAASHSLWKGDCFVFDERVSLATGLREGNFVSCRACRRPVGPDERRSPDFVEGVSCPACVGEKTEDQRRRYSERFRQQKAAESKGRMHVGAVFGTDAADDMRARKRAPVLRDEQADAGRPANGLAKVG
jgi:UPF0176 protein